MIRSIVIPPTTWVRAAVSVMMENATLEEITSAIGVFPDSGGILRDEVALQQFDADGPICRWLIRSAIEARLPAEQHIDSLLRRLELAPSSLREIVDKGALAECYVCVLGDDFAVPVSIAASTVQRLAALSISLRVFFTGERKFLAYSAGLVLDETRGV